MSPEVCLLNLVFRSGGCGAKPNTWARGWDDAIQYCMDLIEETFDLDDDDIMDGEDFIKEARS